MSDDSYLARVEHFAKRFLEEVSGEPQLHRIGLISLWFTTQSDCRPSAFMFVLVITCAKASNTGRVLFHTFSSLHPHNTPQTCRIRIAGEISSQLLVKLHFEEGFQYTSGVSGEALLNFLILLLLVICNTFSMPWGRIFFELFPCSDYS